MTDRDPLDLIALGCVLALLTLAMGLTIWLAAVRTTAHLPDRTSLTTETHP